MLSMGNSLGSFSPLTAPINTGITNPNALASQGMNRTSSLGQTQGNYAGNNPSNSLFSLANQLESKGNMLLQLAGMIRLLLQLLSTLQNADPTANHDAPTYNGGNNGQYWGDPHLVGFDGEKYDVMGEPGKTYNMLSDKNMQYNTKFEKWGDKGGTVIGEAGIQVGNDQVHFDRSGKAPTVNGTELKTGDTVALDNGGSAQWDGKSLSVNTGEYTINLEVKEPNHPNGAYIDSHVNINEKGPFADFVAPHGLLGQTADGVKGEKNTGKDQGKQGGTVIDGTVNDYEVSNLWKNDDKFNRFGVQVGRVITNPADGSITKVLDTRGNIVFQKLSNQNEPAQNPLGGISTAA